MVREANVKQANAEKQLKEALGKVTTLNTHTHTANVPLKSEIKFNYSSGAVS